MKKVFLKEAVLLTGVKSRKDCDRMIDYYIEQPGRERIYAFTRVYTRSTYEMCKSGIRINELMIKRSRDGGVMGLVDHLNIMLPYLREYYEIPARDQ